MIDLTDYLNQLEHSARAVQGLVSGVSKDQARWKPGPKEWSITQVICHLADEEVEDFRTHVDHLLFHVDKPWPSIDPQAWVTQRNYNQQNHVEVLQRFTFERQQSLRWLTELDSPDWDLGIEMPFGKLTAGDVLVSWAAHDLLHLRQLIELHYAYTASSARPYDIRYAGEW